MAEHSFREVMHEVNRLCTANGNCDQNCPLENMGCCGNLGTHCSDPLQAERIENIVMAWAAEHSEPVYPTWEEWLGKQGVLDYRGDYNPVTKHIDRFLNSKAKKPIPADIAEKLGLKPKEVNNAEHTTH